jgi:hypothetical protein
VEEGFVGMDGEQRQARDNATRWWKMAVLGRAHETVSGRLADTLKLAAMLLRERLEDESSDSLRMICVDEIREGRWDGDVWKRRDDAAEVDGGRKKEGRKLQRRSVARR